MQTEAARAALRQTLAKVDRADRAKLQKEWGPKLSWTPSPDAAQALAVMPRTPRHDFDAIYACFDGSRVVGTLALTSVGGYYNGAALSYRAPTLLERKLTPEELRTLERMIGLLEQRLATVDPQSPRHGWTQTVLDTARHLRQAQAPSPAPPAPAAAHQP